MDVERSHVYLMVTWVSDDVVGIEWSRGIAVTDIMIMTRAHRLATITLRSVLPIHPSRIRNLKKPRRSHASSIEPAFLA